ncbi:HGGxSTG domain-containing protein [Stenotrophomonas maltophilia]|uniref:HGGxSTG domain-containing protein n=1 Tax=Stenotrophomonas maltophilia TaxID=40324 RepID=UPI003F7D9F29
MLSIGRLVACAPKSCAHACLLGLDHQHCLSTDGRYMERKSRLIKALGILSEGRPSRARAYNFGWTDAELNHKKRVWEWARRMVGRQRCGAKRRRDGGSCRALSEPGASRCKWHGGMSTGPRTAAGRTKSLANLRQFSKATDHEATTAP